jgi:hypothetical protein
MTEEAKVTPTEHCCIIQESGLPHLSLAAVFDALSYYCDHKEEIDDYIIRNRAPDELTHPSVRYL